VGSWRLNLPVLSGAERRSLEVAWQVRYTRYKDKINHDKNKIFVMGKEIYRRNIVINWGIVYLKSTNYPLQIFINPPFL
jgi:hypothetical protein